MQRIINIHITWDNQPDKIIWPFTKTGKYATVSGYNCLISTPEQAQQNPLPLSNFLWRLPCPPKVQIFLWKALNEGLPTLNILNRIQLTNSNLCPQCSSNPETSAHILLHCQTVVDSWNLLLSHLTSHQITANSIPTSLTPQMTVSQLLTTKSPALVTTTLCFLFWSLWITRNEMVYGSNNQIRPA